MKGLWITFLLVFVIGCKPASEKVVNILTSAILEPVTITSTLGPEIGEVEVSSESTSITVTIKNNSSHPINKMEFLVPKKQTFMSFAENLNNPEGSKLSPGGGGTCTKTLQPGNSCTYVLSFIPKKIGQIEIPFVFNYENLIDLQKKDLVFTAFIGEPASLFFTNETTYYDLGLIEKKYPIQKLLDIEIENGGGLSARNVIYKIANASPAFEIVKNDCPARIPSKMKCNIIVGYTPRNNDPTDPETPYTDRLAIEYFKNPTNAKGKLNSTFKFISTKIEANFVNAGLDVVGFSTLTTGNKESKTITIANTGYREGILKEMIFSDYQAAPNILAICKKATSGIMLDCKKSDGTDLALEKFPFKVEDTNSCFGVETVGVVGKTPGKACSFQVTYWPSIKFAPGSQSVNYFNESRISFKYDSRYEGKENIVISDTLFTINANFKGAGRLAIESVEFDGGSIPDTSLPTSSYYYADLGRIALVSGSQYTKAVTFTLKNEGESALSFKSLTDGASVPKSITTTPSKLDPSKTHDYYQNIVHDCTTLEVAASCTVSFDLSPVKSVNKDNLMYDYIMDKYKKFIFTYNDGSTFLDPESTESNILVNNSIERQAELRLKGILIEKGLLIITTPNIVFPTLVSGSSNTAVVKMTNVGTGPVTAIIKDTQKNLDPLRTPVDVAWPFEVTDQVTPIGADYDCYDLIKPINSLVASFPTTPWPPTFSLGEEKSCSMSIVNKLPETHRITSYGVGADINRPFHSGQNDELWERNADEHAGIPIKFNYYDGDENDGQNTKFGFPKATNEITIGSRFIKPASVVLTAATPQETSVIIKPIISYPSITSGYPIANQTIAAFTSPSQAYFQLVNPGVNTFNKSAEALLYAQTLTAPAEKYLVHVGTFPASSTTPISITLANVGTARAVFTSLTDDGGSNTISPQGTFTSIADINGGGTRALNFNFVPTATAVFTKCYSANYKYEDNLLSSKVKTLNFCIRGEGVASAPKIDISYSDFTVLPVGATSATETDNNALVALSTSLNTFPGTFGAAATFAAIRNSNTYAKKRIRFTNSGGATASKFNFSLLSFPSRTPMNTTIFNYITLEGVPGVSCIGLASLGSGDFCELYIKFKPTAAAADSTSFFFAAQYELKGNQYASNIGGLTFNALTPAILELVPRTTEPTLVDWSTATPIPNPSSYAIDIGTISLIAHPNVTSVQRQVRNTSTIKASFLNLANPNGNAWTEIYTSTDLKINASLGCFYGDDAPTNPDAGFSINSTTPCYLQFNFQGYKNYSSCNMGTGNKSTTIGRDIITACNPHAYRNIPYYNYKRIPDGLISFHIKGSMIPNGSSSASTTVSDAKVDPAKVSFSWAPLVPNNLNWGSIVRNRVYYSTQKSSLGNDIYKTALTTYVDTTNNQIEISGLDTKTYYYFKVVAIRSKDGIEYISNSNIDIFETVIPTSNQVYLIGSKTLLDKEYKFNSLGTRANAISTCAAEYLTIFKDGANKRIYKSLIGTSELNFAKSDSSYNAGYDFDIDLVPHWVSDGPFDIQNGLGLFPGQATPGFPGFNNLNMIGIDEPNKVQYFKICSHNADCNKLHRIVGGDPADELFEGGLLYTTDGAGFTAYPRCKATIE